MPTVSETYALASRHLHGGNFPEAERLFREVVQAEPHHAEAWHLLGLAAFQQGRFDTAIDAIRRAVSLHPGNAIYHSNLGEVCRNAGKPTEAEACLREALKLQPNLAETHNNLGLVLLELRRIDEAAESFRESLRLKPDHADAYNNLGTALHQQGRSEEALANYYQALRLQPQSAETYCNLGSVLLAEDRLEEAEAMCRKALQLQPTMATAYNCLGMVLHERKKLLEAESCYRRALCLNPHFVNAHNNLGNALKEQDRLTEAEACFRKALQLQPDCVEAYYNLGNLLRDLTGLAEAAACYRQALRLKPDFAETSFFLGKLLRDMGEIEEALACYRHALSHAVDSALAPSHLLFCMNYSPTIRREEMFEEHCRWGKTHTHLAAAAPPHRNDPDPDRRLRVGYVSPDFLRHPVAFFFEPLLAHHDPARIEAICYADVKRPDAVTARLQALAHGWRSIHDLSDDAVAEMIRNDGIDILVELTGHTSWNRLLVFARKPAPVQVAYLGYPNTTGLTAIDYRLTDAVLDPPGEPNWYTEELVRLPNGFSRFAPPPEAPEVAPLPALQTGQITFGSLNNLAKLNDEVIDLWCRVLQAVPSARLLIFRNLLKGEMKEIVRRRFLERGLAADRLELRHEDERTYLGVMADIDIALDVFPWAGHTITCESLWMGVPVLTFAGDRPASRLSASVLTCMGLTDWIARTPEEYIALAVQWAGDWERLVQLRRGLRDRMRATICDAEQFTRDVEEAYRAMWRRKVASSQ